VYNLGMIASLNGVIKNVLGNQVILEVQGVGYLVNIGEKLINKLVLNQELELFTYQAVSENDISLFGFESFEEVKLFKMLISVSGVGPRTGAHILSKTENDLVIKAISKADVKFFEDIKGIGKKTAQRIIIDLKSKVGGIKELDLSEEAIDKEDDLYLSLKQLGFDGKEIEKITNKLPKEILIIEEKIQWCLRNLN
jgi:holliday junction DNA helicase RuvA